MKAKTKTASTNYVDELMHEIDINVRELVDTFRFLLKYIVLFKGSGVEFAGLRDYVPEHDDATKIDWKASLRSKKLYVKQFEDEIDLEVYILLDASSSMLFGTQEKLKSEYAAIVAGSLAYAAVEAGEAVGFSMFGDDARAAMDPLADITQYYKILRAVADPKNYGGKCNLADTLSHLVNIVADRTIMFVISDFIGLTEGWDDALRMMSGKIDKVVGMMVRDLRDDVLPEGVGNIRFKDPFTNKVVTVDLDEVKYDFEKRVKKQEREIEKVFLDGGMGFIKMYTHQPFVRPLVHYLELTEF